MQKYLKSSEIIDWEHPTVLKQAQLLANGSKDVLETAKACFLFVRDKIYHSYDYKMNPITLKASEVLKYKTGFCFSKSHLLAALLRGNSIPSGLCYQRLSRDGNGPPFALHGLNAIYLPNFGWYRVDARGNNENINARFDPPVEQLAYQIKIRGEANLLEIWEEPLPQVIEVLSSSRTYEEVIKNLPDVELAL